MIAASLPRPTFAPLTALGEMEKRRERQPLPAATVDPRRHDAATVAAAVRIVPHDAERLTVGGAQLGYRRGSGRSGAFSFVTRRLHELARLIELRHGGPVDTDDGAAYLILAAHCIVPGALDRAAGRPDPAGRVIRAVEDWCAIWVPRVPRGEMLEIVERTIAEPRWFRADTAAKLLRLRMSERMAAGITSIGAIDADAAERARLRKQRHAARCREKRAEAREAGSCRDRATYETGSVAAECRRLGISRTTFYRRRAAEAAKETAIPEARNRCREHHYQDLEEIRVARDTCNAATAPLATRRGGAQRRADEHDSDPTQPLVPAVTEAQAIRTYPARWIAEAPPGAAPPGLPRPAPPRSQSPNSPRPTNRETTHERI